METEAKWSSKSLVTVSQLGDELNDMGKFEQTVGENISRKRKLLSICKLNSFNMAHFNLEIKF
jgi:hypothetical protein